MSATSQIIFDKGVYFISGIDTEIGKTISTGYLAKQLLDQGINVITQKMVQTGNVGQSEDIIQHRQMMGKTFPEDEQGLTAPQIFSYPASPHVATKLDNRTLDFEAIMQATEVLQARYDVVLLEGAGGLMVPLTEEVLSIDYVAEKKYPVILVTSGRLGSINHTLLSLFALQKYQLDVYAVVFNCIHDSQDQLIADETKMYLKNYLKQNFSQTKWIELAALNNTLQ